jgi:hypothetical protein
MNNRTKAVLGAVAALFAISIAFRFAVLSQLGLAGGWIFYLGLPLGGIVAVIAMALRLGLLNFGESPSAAGQTGRHNSAATGPAMVPAPPAATSQRLQELETLRTSGAISDSEYAAMRTRIITGL